MSISRARTRYKTRSDAGFVRDTDRYPAQFAKPHTEDVDQGSNDQNEASHNLRITGVDFFKIIHRTRKQFAKQVFVT